MNRRKIAAITAAVVLLLIGVALAIRHYVGNRAEVHYLNSVEFKNESIWTEDLSDDMLLRLGRQACMVAQQEYEELVKDDDGIAKSHFATFNEHYLQVGLDEEEAKSVMRAATAHLCPSP